jgi:hypothetical protein
LRRHPGTIPGVCFDTDGTPLGRRAPDDMHTDLSMKKFLSIELLIGFVLMAISGSVMTGWLTHSEALIRSGPAFKGMLFNSALCFFALGIAFVLPAAAGARHRGKRAVIGWSLIVLVGVAILDAKGREVARAGQLVDQPELQADLGNSQHIGPDRQIGLAWRPDGYYIKSRIRIIENGKWTGTFVAELTCRAHRSAMKISWPSCWSNSGSTRSRHTGSASKSRRRRRLPT